MIEQNPEDPTGVEHASGDSNNHVTRARQRKANSALAMKLAGANWTEIAQTLGYGTPRSALVAVEKALEQALDGTDREYMRGLAGARLERLLRSIWPKAIDPEHAEQMIAVSKAREVIADHRRLFGLDAPTEVIVHQPTRVELEEWVAKVVNSTNPPVVEGEVIDIEWDDEAADG